MSYYNSSLSTQISGLIESVKANEALWNVLYEAPKLGLNNWYVGAGCLAQTVWNIQTGLSPNKNIKDIDLVYFDSTDLSKESEKQREEEVRHFFKDVPLEIDLKNQARVHLWYEDKFGYPIESYTSSENAVNTWPTTATSIAITLDTSSQIQVYALYGLNDVFGMIARANKTQITEEIFNAKVKRWKKCWPDLVIVPWHQS